MNMGRLIIGAIAAAAAMLLIGGLFYASGIQSIAFRALDDGRAAAVQQALAANVGAETGTYVVPDTGTAQQTAMYGKGPIATIHYNYRGFAAGSGAEILNLVVLDLLVALLMALGLAGLARRGADTSAIERLVICFAIAASAYIHLKEPVFLHHGWWTFIYQFLADALTLALGGFIIARWFLPPGPLSARAEGAPVPGDSS
jgi:hypothetical protein